MGRAERRESHTAEDNVPGIGSGTLTPDAFNQMITDASSFSLTLDSGTRNAIQWIAAKDSILIGTTGGEWSLSGHTRDKPITPTSYNLRDHTTNGSKDLQPILLTDGFAFVNYVGRKLFKMDYDGIDEDYTANELSILAEHITDSGIVDMAFQRNPDPILWLVREDGVLLSMTYDPKQDVVAWARHYAGLSTTTSEPRLTVNTQYPLLRPTTDQVDPELPQGTLISNAEDLQAMENNLSGSYYLANDIDASDTINWDSGKGFDPIGFSTAAGQYFSGTFDGNGYTISNLYINRTTQNGNALFGNIGGGAQIANVTLTDVNITGQNNTGALVGYAGVLSIAKDLLIQNCHSSGTVTTKDAVGALSFLGGLIGSTEGDDNPYYVYVYDCSSSCTVIGPDGVTSIQYVGGLIGWVKNSIVSNCFATGAVSGGTKSNGVGGLFGILTSGTTNYASTIDYCYATGNISGKTNVGGLMGQNDQVTTKGSIEKCYSTGNVTGVGTGSIRLGGFIGKNVGDITDCYAWGDVTSAISTSTGGGFIAFDNTNAAVVTNCYSIGAMTAVASNGGFTDDGGNSTYTNCYWDTEASGNATSDTGTGRATTSMKTEDDYASTWDFDAIWYMLPIVQEIIHSVRSESVAVIPSTAEDEVWVTVARIIGGNTVRYIERMKPRSWGDDMEDMFFVDSGLTYDGDPASNFTGLGHLEGETVAILGDGAVFATQTVTGGTLPNDLDHTVSVAQIGLPSTYKLKPMRMDQNIRGTSKGSIGKITEAVISFYKTLNARYGDGIDTLDINWRETDAEYTTPPDLFTGDKVVVADGGFKAEDPFQIEGSDPMSCSVRAIIPRIETTGR